MSNVPIYTHNIQVYFELSILLNKYSVLYLIKTTIFFLEKEYEHDKTDDRDDEENTIDDREIVSAAESVTSDPDSAQNKTLSSCDRPRRRNRKPLRFSESEDDSDYYYPSDGDDDPEYKEKPHEKRQRLSNVSLPAVQDQVNIRLLHYLTLLQMFGD